MFTILVQLNIHHFHICLQSFTKLSHSQHFFYHHKMVHKCLPLQSQSFFTGSSACWKTEKTKSFSRSQSSNFVTAVQIHYQTKGNTHTHHTVTCIFQWPMWYSVLLHNVINTSYMSKTRNLFTMFAQNDSRGFNDSKRFISN